MKSLIVKVIITFLISNILGGKFGNSRTGIPVAENVRETGNNGKGIPALRTLPQGAPGVSSLGVIFVPRGNCRHGKEDQLVEGPEEHEMHNIFFTPGWLRLSPGPENIMKL